MEIQLPESERRWLHAVLVLGTAVLALILLGQVATILVFFSDILLILLLAWLLAFMISPLVNLIRRPVPWAPWALVVASVYVGLVVGLVAITIAVASSLAASIGNFINELPTLQARLPELLAPVEAALARLGFEVDLAAAGIQALNFLATVADDLIGPLTNVALAGLGLLAGLLIVVFLSLFIVLDKDRLVAYVNRLVPPRFSAEARLFETSVASSFGGFIRGQTLQGLILGAIAAAVHFVLGLEFLPASAALVAVLQIIPFFGAIVSWAPPVLVALLTQPDLALPALIGMAAGWLFVNNYVVPKVMSSAVGIHPVAVLIAILFGLKLAGVAGAMFAIPFAAVIAAFFHHFLERSSGGPKDVASRAARRLEEREGRRVRVPTAPPVPVAGAVAEAASDDEPAAKRNRPRPPTDTAPEPMEPGP
jgi:predicted PurR-regulated permease PerM